MAFAYLASPYSSGNGNTMEMNYLNVVEILAALCRRGHVCVCPISMHHDAAHLHDLPRTWEFWENIDKNLINSATTFIVADMTGWKDSEGVKAEIKHWYKIKCDGKTETMFWNSTFIADYHGKMQPIGEAHYQTIRKILEEK